MPVRPVAERGYALIAAVAAIAVFGALALAIVTATRISIASGTGELARARADLAADAGLAMAEHGLMTGNDTMLGLVHGGEHQFTFDGNRVTIRISDERGKIPLSHIEGDMITRMFAQAGLSGEQLAIASDSLQDWMDDDDQPRASGAEALYYAQQNIAPRNGGLWSVDELARVRGVGPAIMAKLRNSVTVDREVLSIDPAYAQSQALAVLSEAGDLSPAALARSREEQGQQTALSTTRAGDVINHPMTIAVDADSPGGGHAHHEATIVVTGKAGRPYVIHAVR
jgi:general secretion pathway protein K